MLDFGREAGETEQERTDGQMDESGKADSQREREREFKPYKIFIFIFYIVCS